MKGIINRRTVLFSEKQKALYQLIVFQNVNILLSIIISKIFEIVKQESFKTKTNLPVATKKIIT